MLFSVFIFAFYNHVSIYSMYNTKCDKCMNTQIDREPILFLEPEIKAYNNSPYFHYFDTSHSTVCLKYFFLSYRYLYYLEVVYYAEDI